jgi:hypothetical protein
MPKPHFFLISQSSRFLPERFVSPPSPDIVVRSKRSKHPARQSRAISQALFLHRLAQNAM